MQLKVLAFSHVRAQLGFGERLVEFSPGDTPRQILRRMAPEFDPGRTVRVAVNQEYGDWDTPVGEAHELALIPPVSGG